MAFITAYLGFGGLLPVLFVLLFTEYRAEVKPASALVYNNQWTGATNALLPGTHFLVPGVHKRLEEVTIRNEAKNPSNVMLFTGDGRSGIPASEPSTPMAGGNRFPSNS